MEKIRIATDTSEKHNAIQAVIDAHNQFEEVFKGDATKVWQDLLKADYPGSSLNKILHLKQ